MDQHLTQTIKQLPISNKDKQLCLDALRNNPNDSQSQKKVLNFLIGLVQQKLNRARALNQEVNAYLSIANLYHQTQKKPKESPKTNKAM